MIKTFSLKEVSKVIGAQMRGQEASFTEVSTDTRTMQRGALFVALQGENFNGNAFVDEAESLGAVGVIVNELSDTPLPQLVVEDTALALGEIGSFNRSLSSACVIAITGSQGKTTVKEMLASILSCCGETLMTKGNLNNTLGVPMTLLNIDKIHKYAVIELGANAAGEISRSVAYVNPDIAHITNVASTHLLGFGDLEGVALAKSELWEGLGDGGLAVINIDDEFSGAWVEKNINRPSVRVSAKGNPIAEYSITSYTLSPQGRANCELRTPYGTIKFTLALLGQHNLANALAATAIALEAGASLQNAVDGLEKMQPIPGRLNTKSGKGGAIIIDDSYNASPSSFEAAIDVLATMPGKKIVVAGDMGELGSEEAKSHQRVGEYAKAQKIDSFFGVGRLSAISCDYFGFDAQHFKSQEDLVGALIPELNANVFVLVKGSRSAGLDGLVKQLLLSED